MADWLDELERLEREATPFPWEPVPGHGVIESPTHVVESGYRSEANVQLIAILRNRARDLIEAARRCEELEAIVAEQAKLLGAADVALELVKRWAEHAHSHWDADEDHKVGKCLMALAGHLPRYAPDTDGIHSLWKQIRDYRAAEAAQKGGA
jgi:hypothetical protein